MSLPSAAVSNKAVTLDYEYILGALDKIEDILIHFDGRYMRPLASSDGPYLN